MKNGQKVKYRKFASSQIGKSNLLVNLKTGENRCNYAKESNFNEISTHLSTLKIMTTLSTVNDATDVIKGIIERNVEVQQPLEENVIGQKKLSSTIADTAVEAILSGISVRLDNGQLKHQHPLTPIGNRITKGGNRFIQGCDETWHINSTMQYMAEWATTLGTMQEGEQVYHGQANPVDGIHYEGFCLFTGGKKYVLFHCYPSDHSSLKLTKDNPKCVQENIVSDDNQYNLPKPGR